MADQIREPAILTLGEEFGLTGQTVVTLALIPLQACHRRRLDESTVEKDFLGCRRVDLPVAAA
jgi:hypothetical protein